MVYNADTAFFGFPKSSGAAPFMMTMNTTGVTIGTYSNYTPLNKLDVGGGVAIGSYATVNTAPSNGLIVSGNVGIGTTSPGFQLDVVGNLRWKSASYSGGNTGITFFHNAAGANDYGLVFRKNGVDMLGVDTDQSVYTNITSKVGRLYLSAGGTNENVVLSPSGTGYSILNGNVGIGTTSPSAKLTVDGLQATDVGMLIKGASGQSADLFRIRNSADSRLLTVDQSGNLTISGNVGIGTTNPGYILDVQHASSKINSKNGYLTNGADYAEYFYSKDGNLEPGEIVCIDITTKNSVKRCTNSGDMYVMGVVSTNSAFLGNSSKDKENNPNYSQIALLGQIPAKVSSENGAIEIGDELTSSTKLGYARKANPGESTVGVALEKFSEQEGTIQVMISRKNKSLTVEKVEDQIAQRIAEMNIKDQVDKLVADAVNSYNLQNNLKLLTIDASGNMVLGSDPSTVVVAKDNLETTKDLANKIKTLEEKVLLLEAQFALGVGDTAPNLPKLENVFTITDKDISVDSNLVAFKDFNVLGKTTLSDLVVTGKITTGLLVIDGVGENGVSLSALSGDMVLQNLVTITSKGDVELKEGVIAGNSSFREVVVVSGETTEVVINRTWDKAPTTVTVTPSYETTIWVENVTKDGFNIKLGTAPTTEQKLYWLAVW